MKIGLSLATAAFLAALLSSIDAQGKLHHSAHLHTLSHSVSLFLSLPPINLHWFSMLQGLVFYFNVSESSNGRFVLLN